MPLDMDKLAKRVAEIYGPRSAKNIIWMPKPRSEPFYVRIVPRPDTDNEIAYELWTYDAFGPKCLAPCMYGKPDPVTELIAKLNADLGRDAWLTIKKIKTKSRYYVPIIVRDNPPDVKIWSLSFLNHQKLIGFFFDKDYGDLTDVEHGFDVKIIIKQNPGQMFPASDFVPRPKQSPLGHDVRELQSKIPDVKSLYKMPTYEELKARLDAWATSESVKQVSERQDADVEKREQDDRRRRPQDDRDVATSSPEKDIDAAFDEFLDDK